VKLGVRTEERKRILAKHAVVHDTIDMPQEMTISVELRDDDVHSTLWETDFGSSSEIIVLQNAIWLMPEQRASVGGREMRQREEVKYIIHDGILIQAQVLFQIISGELVFG
jgi:hypothetical protein